MSLAVITCVPRKRADRAAPRWKRSVLYDPDSGEVYAPAEATPVGALSVLAAAWDGVQGMADLDGHPFLPLSWLEREYPENAELWALMRANVARANAREAQP